MKNIETAEIRFRILQDEINSSAINSIMDRLNDVIDDAVYDIAQTSQPQADKLENCFRLIQADLLTIDQNIRHSLYILQEAKK